MVSCLPSCGFRSTIVSNMDFVPEVVKLVVKKKLDVWVIIQVFVLNLAWMLALSIPMAVLSGTLMAFGRLASDSEVLAMKASGISPKMNYYQDPQTLAQDFNAGRLDLVTTNALNYLRMAPQIEPNRDSDIYGAISGGKKTYQYLVLARADAGVADFTNLCGKTSLIQANDPTAAIYLNSLLSKHGQPAPHVCFQEVMELPSLSQVVLGVFFKKGVVGITTKSMFETMVDLNPQLGKQLTILAASPELANGIFFFHKQVAPEVKALLLKHILNLKATSYGQQILVLYKIDGLAPFEPTDLDSTKVLLQEDEQLKP